MLRIAYQEMRDLFEKILLAEGFKKDRAKLCSDIFADNSLYGVTSHGVNRFPRFIRLIRNAKIDIHASATFHGGFGVIEQWEGHHAPGPVNATQSTSRAMEIAKNNGMGCVALRNTTHWMRGGTYGWQAAESGYIFIGWTNTMQNLPPWGGIEAKIGNNPLIMGIPRKPTPIVLDTAMSQYSYGKLEGARNNNQTLSQPGGYDREGTLSCDPGAILDSGRLLPIGFWTGAGLSFVLDVIASLLSDGNATHQVGKGDDENNLSQVFIAIHPDKLIGSETREKKLAIIIEDLKKAQTNYNTAIFFPGERAAKSKEENLQKGIPVNPKTWETIKELQV